MREKLLSLLAVLVLASGMATASHPGTDTYDSNAPGDQAPDTEQRPSNVPSPDKGVSGAVGGITDALLPKQASQTAKNVLNTIIDTPVQSIGDALQNLLGGQTTDSGNTNQ